jgi:hypothetical protein
MRTPKKSLKPNDREVVARAQFRTGAGPMRVKRLDPKSRRMKDRLEEKRALADPEE